MKSTVRLLANEESCQIVGLRLPSDDYPTEKWCLFLELAELADAFHLRSDIRFPHVGQLSLFFNMFVLHLIGQKLHTQFLEIFTPSFFMGLEVFKEKSKKMNMITRKDD
jgi:hypothetical protein